MIKQIIRRFFKCIFILIVYTLIILIINGVLCFIFSWDLSVGLIVGFLICFLVAVPYNKEEIELDKCIEKNNKNGFD